MNKRAIEEAFRAGPLPYLRALDRDGLLLPKARFDLVHAVRVADLVVEIAQRPIEPGRPLPGIWIKPVRLATHRAQPAHRDPHHIKLITRHRPTWVNVALGDLRTVGWRWQIAGSTTIRVDRPGVPWKGMPGQGWQWFTEHPHPSVDTCARGLRARLLDVKRAIGWVEELARRLLVDLERVPMPAPKADRPPSVFGELAP